MHEAGAEAHTIAQQTGHQSIKTLTDHYLTVSNTTIDKYLRQERKICGMSRLAQKIRAQIHVIGN